MSQDVRKLRCLIVQVPLYKETLKYIKRLTIFLLLVKYFILSPVINDLQIYLLYGLKVFLLTKIKPEYYDILYNLTHFPGPLVCRIRQVLISCTIRHISLVPWCVGLKRITFFFTKNVLKASQFLRFHKFGIQFLFFN
jgi:hypothetical protein